MCCLHPHNARKNGPEAQDQMSAHSSTLDRFLIVFVVCVLFCAVLSAELPELLSLTDNASHDFTIHKTSTRELAQALHAAIDTHVLRHAEQLERTTYAPFPPNTETPSSSLFPLHSILRS